MGIRLFFEQMGFKKSSQWMLDEKRTLITDTTMRDIHQSMLTTRMRTYDMVQVAEAYIRKLPDLFSPEYWGKAIFGVSMQFLNGMPMGSVAHFAPTYSKLNIVNAFAWCLLGWLHNVSKLCCEGVR